MRRASAPSARCVIALSASASTVAPFHPPHLFCRTERSEPTVRKEDVLKLPSMPAAGPSYPAGPYRFIDREYMVITYETDGDIIRAQLPDPLEPVGGPVVH